MRIVMPLLLGLLFGVGIVIGGMANPAKVLNFFDVAGSWDPSLAFVMGGALAVTIPGYRLVMRRRRPVAAPVFDLPTRTDIEPRLIVGSAIFGIGWGLSGFCPGGAVPALGTGSGEVAVFLVSLVVGLALAQTFKKRQGGSTVLPTP